MYGKLMGCVLILAIAGWNAGAMATETQWEDALRVLDARELELMAGKSFVLETALPVGRVAVGSEAIAQARALSDESILIQGVRPGVTNLILWYKQGDTQVYDLVVKLDLGQIQKAADRLFPDLEVTLETIAGADPRSGGFLLARGTVSEAETLDSLLDLLKTFVHESRIRNFVRVTGPMQVQLDVRIAEVSRSNMKTLGFRWQYRRMYERGDLFISHGNMTSSEESGSSYDEEGASENETSRLIRSFADAVSQDIAGKGIGVILSCLDGDLLSILDLLETQNLAKILARPTLTAVSGRAAEFMVGGEFPVPVQDDGDVTIDYKPYGVKLTFAPTVIRKETVYMDVQTSVSDIDYSTTVGAGGTVVPGVTTREARTSLELKDGQSFAIAGLLKENIASIIDKIPVLGDLPVLGALFRSKEFRKSETELVIVVTPHLVKPMNPGKVPPLPGEEMTVNQNLFDFIFTDRIGKPKTAPDIRFQGPAGFER